ncbi:MAG: DUF1080 domain-containing protein [Candidatus Saccharicenans sp.]
MKKSSGVEPKNKKNSGQNIPRQTSCFPTARIIFTCGMFIFILVLSACSLSTSSSAGSAGKDFTPQVKINSPEQVAIILKVDSWLRQLPAANQAESEKIFSEMLDSGSPAIRELARRLVPPGEEDDHLVRYAIDGLITRAGLPGQEKQKEHLADELLEIAATARPVEVKKFLLEEAQYLVSQKHLKPLAAHLQNPELAEYAIKAMLRVPVPELEIILLNNLDRLPSDSKKPVIQALGLLRSKKAVNKLRLLTEADDREIKNLALAALAEIADPATEPIFASVSTLAGKSEKKQVVELYLRFARRLAEEGHKEQALKIARKSVRNLTAPEEIGQRTEALTIIFDNLGETAKEEILVALQDENKQFRKHALDLASQRNWPELTTLLAKKLPELKPEIQAEIIEYFGTVNDSSLAQVVAGYLASPEENVRLAALKTFARLSKKEALPYLLAGTKGSEPELALCLDLLRTYPTEAYLSELRKIFPELPEPSKARLLQNLQDIISPQWKELVWQSAHSENPELKKAAADCLAQVVDRNDLDQLIIRLSELDDPALASGYQQAVVAALNRIPDINLRQRTYLDYLDKAKGNTRVNLIKLLPQVSGTACLKKAAELLNDRDPAIKNAAVAAVTSWNEFEAAGILVNLIKTTTDRKTRYLAFQGLARLMKNPNATKEEKLSTLQKAKPLATYPDEKNFMLTAWASIRDVGALKEISEFFSDENLRERAVDLACRLARPVAGEEGLKGFETIMILKKALPFLKEDLEIQETEDYLDRLLKEEGFVPLFNRKDLFGWKGLVGDPVQRARMKLEELRSAQEKADEDMRQHWKVVDGVLVFDGKGHSLCTVKDYCDFEMFVDWKIEPGGDSGIYLRSSPQVQIWDPAQWPEGSGGLYNNQKNPSKPLKRADNPVGTWNTFYIKMVDERVTVYLNGELVVDNVVMENYWERDKPIYRCGQIELQAHNTPLYFKNIYLREIK